MKLYLLVCSALFIPLILGTNDSTTIPEHKKITETVAKKVDKTALNVTNTLITEGGTIIQNTPSLVDLIAVHKELGSNSHSTIVARKEAKLNETDVYPLLSNATDNNIDKIKNKTHKKDSALKNATQTIESESEVKNSSYVTTSKPVETKKPEKFKPTKPPILSYEKLANMDLKFESTAESHKKLSLVDVASGPITKDHPSIQRSGMIMPIVIGILVVPMFAVLGYMALRRGQEAWKNRHYKRMDFLLDGMYNE